MKSSRWPLAAALAIVVAGVVASGVAYLATRPAESEVSLSFVPSSATLVGQLDVRALASSPLADFWSRIGGEGKDAGPSNAIADAIGIDVLRDLDTVTFSFAGKGEGGEVDRWGIVATGTFDNEALLRKMSGSALESVEHAGTRIHRFLRDGKNESAMAFARGGSTLLLGETTYLREMLDAGKSERKSATALVESFSEDFFAGETFWLAGSSGGAIAPMLGDSNLVPPLESFSVSGRLDAELVLQARGRASDADSAQELADVVRGLVALGRLSAGGSNPELAKLAETVSIDLLDRDIEIHLRVPYETIQKLSERKEAEEQANRR